MNKNLYILVICWIIITTLSPFKVIAGTNGFDSEFIQVANYSDLNNRLEKEQLTPAELLKTNVRGFILRLEVDTDERAVKIVTPDKEKVNFTLFLTDLNNFFKDNPGEIITLFIDYNFPSFYIEDALRSSNLYNSIFNPDENNSSNWPSLNQIANDGDKLIFFTLQNHTDAPALFHYTWDYMVQPYFSTSLQPDFHGEFIKGDSGNILMFFNGYNLPRDTTGIEIPFTHKHINENPFLISHLINLWKTTGKQPNFIVHNSYDPVFESIIENLKSLKTIKGDVTYNLQPLSDVSWKGSRNAITSGRYSFPFLAGEELSLSPFKPGFEFTPKAINVNRATSNITQNFIATPLNLDHKLKAYYRFNGDASDSGPNRDHGEAHNINYKEDEEKGTVAFLGDSAWIKLSGAEEMGIHNSDFTVSAWIKLVPREEGERRDRTILGTIDPAYRQGLHLQLRYFQPYFGFYANDATGKRSVRFNEWVHIVWRYTKSTGEQAIFVNGREDVVSQNHPSFMGRGDIYIGKAIEMENYLNGFINDMAIWDRPLGDQEIWKLYLDVLPIYKKDGLTYIHYSLIFIITFIATIFLLIITKKITIIRGKKSEKIIISSYSKLKEELKAFRKSNSVLLFGEFKVINNKSQEITQLFTPKVRQLFILILLKSVKNGKGISSEEINSKLWFGLDKKKATNNRGVNMNKLRLILKELDGVTIENNMENWFLKIEPETLFCDYIEIVSYLNNKPVLNNPEDFFKFFTFIERGPLLEDTEYEWLDDFKGDISSKIVDILIKQINEPSLKYDPETVIKICDRIFMEDSTSEEALKAKIEALLTDKHINRAKYTYQWFADNYRKSMGENYDKTFDEIK
ncbi:hypothetical protein QA597_10995 [Marinilabiliaceae bacterium ANBcel2]|nr:hypothetical protein [Marinilabiliaceae bacterium ANBcel2]